MEDQPGKRIKNRKKRSWVWTYFDEDTSKPSKGRFVQCLVPKCKETIQIVDKSTNPMINHLEKKHDIFSPESPAKKPRLKEDLISKDQQASTDNHLYVILNMFLQIILLTSERISLHPVTPL